MSTDTARSRDFYGELFGWTSYEPNPDFGGYFNFLKDGVPVAGGFPAMPDAPVPNVWSVYLATADAEKTTAAATEQGAQIIVPPMAVGDLGVMSVVSDPAGGVIGMWQPGSHKGIGVLAEAGTPVWFELMTRDYPTAVPFYRDVFGWDVHAVSDTPEFRYTTLGKDEGAMAGIMDAAGFLPDGVPSHWSVYFGVEDADVALDTIVKLGGTVVEPAQDTPFGRLATATDAVGARFKISAPNEAMPARPAS
jgi:predicted enzyme related to lactoylglutathione lyase